MSYINTLTTGTGTLTYYSDVTGNLQLQTDGNILIGMTNSATGRLVGIGTSTPAYNLDVVGNVRISGNLTVNGSNGFAFSDGTVQTSAASPYVIKNRIINGAMQVWQRGTSFASTAGYTTDRWSTIGYGSYNETVSQSTSVPTTAGNAFQYSLKLQRPASSTGTIPVLIGQAIESVNCYDLSSQTVTLSFWARAGANYSSSGSTLTTQLFTGTTADQGITSYTTWAGYALPISNASTILTTSWQKFSYTATLGSGILEAAIIFYFTPSGTAGADDSVYITGVQLEIGTTATPFERRLYNQELANCQRYYTQSYDYGNVAGTIQRIGAITTVAPAAQNFLQLGQSAFPVSMRTTPAITLYNPDTGSSNITLAIRNYTGSSNLSASVATVSSTSLRVTLNNVASTTDSVYGVHYTALAEL